jgi:hypothetical protein
MPGTTAGGSGAPATGTGAAGAITALPPDPIVMRRLTRLQYDNTVRDLLGETGKPADAFPSEESVHHFQNNSAALSFPPALAEYGLAAAERMAARVSAGLAQSLPCSAASPNPACAQSFIQTFGARAWRRPLAADEVTRIMGTFNVGAGESFARGIELATTTMLVSVPFFYRVERGTMPVQGRADLFRLDPWEVASRLSYTLWNTIPDAPLFAAAQASQLATPEAVRAQAERMLADPKARDVLRDFHSQWLALGGIADINKDPMLFPRFDTALRDLFREEILLFLDDVAWGMPGTFPAIFTSPTTFANRQLATFYGLGAAATGTQFQKVNVNPAQRAGLLTKAGILAMLAGFDQSSPTLRGELVREQLLCQIMPEPPPTVANTPSPPSAAQTTRERSIARLTDVSCSPCHRLMDPIGFGFERYDAAGLIRDTESGKAVDDSGEVHDSPIGAFKGVADLSQKLAADAQTRACFVRQWFRYAFGRIERASDNTSLAAMEGAFSGGGGRYRDLLLATTASEAFLYRAR